MESQSDLSQEQIESLVETVFDSLDKDGDGHISKKEFFKLDSKNESILRPLYIMQDTLQKRCLGQNFWDEERDRMRAMLKEYQEKTIIDLLANRVAAKYEAERLAKARAMGEEVEEDKKKTFTANVKGFDDEEVDKNKKLQKGFVSHGGPVITAADQRAKKEAYEKQKKEKAREKRIKEGKPPDKKKKKKEPKKETHVNIKGVQKKQTKQAESWAMKHQDQLEHK